MSGSKFILHVDSLNVAAGKKPILNDVSFTAVSGEVVALMGPSGAGKTTLLTCLTTPQITSKFTTTGSIKLNGEHLAKYRDSGKLIGYAPQFDVYFPSFTAEEHLEYKARLKFPTTVTAEERTKRIMEVVNDLKISHCMKTHLGGEGDKSLSGGEIKRVMVTSEIITKPPILILDEPTTGLDSAAASTLIRTLKNLAKQEDCIILLSLHQPSSTIYFAFDRVLWMAQGELAADCTPTQLVGRLETIGLPCPEGEVVSNHMMDLLQDEKQLATIKTSRDELVVSDANISNVDTVGKKSISHVLAERQFPNRAQQFLTLTMRHFKLRAATYLSLSCIINKILISFMLVTVWFGSWTQPMGLTERMRNHLGFMFFQAQHFAYDSYYASMGDQRTERAVARGELSTRVYGYFEYSLSRVLGDVLFMGIYFTLIVTTGLLAGQAWEMEFWRWISIYAIGFGHIMCCTSLCKMCGHFIMDERSAAIVGDLYMTLTIWTAGFYMVASTIPASIKWFRWIGQAAQAYTLFVHVAYDELEYVCDGAMSSSLCSPGQQIISGSELYDEYGLTMPLWYCGTGIIVFWIMFEMISIFGAKYMKVLKPA